MDGTTENVYNSSNGPIKYTSSIDADGNEVPVADGEYEIAVKDADGKEAVLAVTAKDGKISEVETTEQSVKEAEDARKRAEQALKNKASQEEIDMLQDEVRRSVLALKLTQKIKH